MSAGPSRRRGPFDPRIVISLIAAGVVAFGLFLILLAYAGDMRGGRDGRPHALSSSAVGFSGVIRLMALAGGRPHLIRDAGELRTEDMVVVALEPRTSPQALGELLERRGTRATLIVLPKWSTVPDPMRPGWVSTDGHEPPELYTPLLAQLGNPSLRLARPSGRTARGEGLLDGLAVPLPGVVQTISGPGLTPILGAPGAGAVLARVGERALFVLSEPDLLNNKGIKDPAAALGALRLLDGLNSTDAATVSFDLTLNGFVRRPNLLKLAFEPPFVALTVALFVAMLLAGMHGAFRFGAEAEEERAIAFGKGALVENAAALFRIARREHRTGAAYAELMREAAAHASGAHLALAGTELDAYLDRVSPPGGPKFTDIAARAGAASSRLDLLAAARALFQWKKDLIK
jgi:hypothetical protein